MCQQRNIPSSIMNIQGNMVTQKENDNSPGTNLKVMEGGDLNGRELKIAVMKNLKERQENSEK